MVIVKAPTKHGLDRKFKSWRRGKSEKSNKRSSLKQQLRGVERLLQKLPDDNSEKRSELQQKIQYLQTEIAERRKVLGEKKNAEKAHGQRFLDRQRLTRQEKHLRNKNDDDKAKESELFKIALDQVYVAHHPNDIKYMPLFRKGERVVDTSRQLYRRAVTRRRILKTLMASKDKQNCPWISKDQYARLPSVEWTIQDEERVFGGSITREGMKEIKQKRQKKATEDSRFSLAPQHEAVLQVADRVDKELDEVEEVGDDTNESSEDNDSDVGTGGKNSGQVAKAPTVKSKGMEPPKNDSESDDSSSSDSDEESDMVDPLKKTNTTLAKGAAAASSESDDSSDSSSSSDDDSDDEPQKGAMNSSKDDDDSESSTSDSSEENAATAKQEPPKRALETATAEDEEEEEVDEFLVDAKEDDDVNVFSMTLKQVPAAPVKGDKSKGWETQRQRPGQFKKPRVRR